MGMACIKGNRLYFGSEQNQEVNEAAAMRLGRTIELAARGDFKLWTAKPGMARTHMEQVLVQLLCVALFLHLGWRQFVLDAAVKHSQGQTSKKFPRTPSTILAHSPCYRAEAP